MDNKEESRTYRSIFKNTSLFGGVQVLNILISVIRSKIIAVLLGPAGVGVQGLFTTATDLIKNITSFGLSTSAVKNIAEAYSTNNNIRLRKVVTSFRKLVWVTGLLGMTTTIVLSPLLSHVSFGNSHYVVSFIFLSIILLFDQLASGQLSLLQGTHRLKELAKASVYGSVIGLVITIPLYYYFRMDGIVPVLVLGSFVSLLVSWLLTRKVDIEKIKISYKEVFSEGKSMIVMGFVMSIGILVTFISSYVLRGCIRYWGGIESVGIFTAGFALVNQYTGLVFRAMGTDYYPRLAAVNTDNMRCQDLINKQGEIGVLVLAPLIMLFIVFIPQLTLLLYSEKFLDIRWYVVFACSGMLFKMSSWSISYVFIAKGEAKLFLINEITAGLYGIGLNLLAYYFYGMLGLGVSFAITFVVYFLQVYLIAKKKYNFHISKSFLIVWGIQSTVLFFCVASCFLQCILLRYMFGLFAFIISAFFSVRELNQRMSIKELIWNKLKIKNNE